VVKKLSWFACATIGFLVFWEYTVQLAELVALSVALYLIELWSISGFQFSQKYMAFNSASSWLPIQPI